MCDWVRYAAIFQIIVPSQWQELLKSHPVWDRQANTWWAIAGNCVKRLLHRCYNSLVSVNLSLSLLVSWACCAKTETFLCHVQVQLDHFLIVHLSHSFCVEAGIYFWIVLQFSGMVMLLSNFDDLDLSTSVIMSSKFVGGFCESSQPLVYMFTPPK